MQNLSREPVVTVIVQLIMFGVLCLCAGTVGVKEPRSWYSTWQILQHMEKAARRAAAG